MILLVGLSRAFVVQVGHIAVDADVKRVGHKMIESGICSFSLVSTVFGGHQTSLFDCFCSISLVSTAFVMKTVIFCVPFVVGPMLAPEQF